MLIQCITLLGKWSKKEVQYTLMNRCLPEVTLSLVRQETGSQKPMSSGENKGYLLPGFPLSPTQERTEVPYLAAEDVDKAGEGGVATVVNAFQPELCSGERELSRNRSQES